MAEALAVIFFLSSVVMAFLLYFLRNQASLRLSNENDELRSLIEEVKRDAENAIRQVKQSAHEQQSALVQKWNATIERSRRLKTLAEAEQEAERITTESEEIQKNAEGIMRDVLNARARATADAREENKRLKAESESVRQIMEAMRNAIEGYDDRYLIPPHTLTDDLAADFGHAEAGQKLKEAKIRSRRMVECDEAATSGYPEPERRKDAIRFVLDAFNGKVESALSDVKYNNFGKLEREIRDGFLLVNRTGSVFQSTRITNEYLAARLDELRWACAALELKRQEQEEQRAIRERMREEEKARKEYEKVQRDAEKEETRLRKEIEQARKMAEVESASAAQREAYEAKLRELEGKLTEAEQRGMRAISMAQQTKQGNVYIISNVGSFGENILKIGMTRRLVPEERVNELGDASVPFRFDIHAMIFSKDAPALETALHRHFALMQMNKVNHRREFFRISLSEVRSILESQGITETHWTMAAEAREYRETLKIEEDIRNNPAVRDEWLARQIRLDIEDEVRFGEEKSDKDLLSDTDSLTIESSDP